jgi:branched-chain amino acid aminotransferase
LAEAYEWAYRGGELVRHRDLTIHAESIAMRYAVSAFEGVRGYVQADGGEIRYFALDEHVERLQQTLRLIGLPPLAPGEVEAAAARLLQANGAATDCYLRVAVNAVSLGTLKGRTETEVFASLQPMGRKPLGESGEGLSVAISGRHKPSDDVFPQRAKVICNYGGPRLAYLEARERGFDDVILTSAGGALSEAPTANLFLVVDGVLATPRLCDGILEGITRRHLIALARSLGWTVAERALAPGDAYRASEAFLCGTGLELAPIARIDDHRLAAERPVCTGLAKAYFGLVRGAGAGSLP